MEVSQEQNVMNAPHTESPACDHCTVPKMSQSSFQLGRLLFSFLCLKALGSAVRKRVGGCGRGGGDRNCLKSSSMPVID